MTKEDKKLLLKDLSARLNYGLRIQLTGSKTICSLLGIRHNEIYTNVDSEPFDVDFVKPYLRPMSSMTEDEKKELLNRLPKYWSPEIDKLGDLYFDICDASYPDIELLTDIIDWLNKHHFDYRGLIEKGLALEAPEVMYKHFGDMDVVVTLVEHKDKL